MLEIQVAIELEGNRIYITSDTYDRDRCKSISGSRWNKDRRQWHTPLSWAHCIQLRAVFGQRLKIGPALTAWAREELTERINPSVALRQELGLPDNHPILSKLQELGYA